jgi:hypothetical protein
MSQDPPQFTEEELAQLEAEMERITVDDVLLQTIVSLINLAARKAGLTAPPAQAPQPDWPQVRLAIEGARALLPLLEPRHGPQLAPIRDGLARLQMHYAQHSGDASAPGPAEEGEPVPPQAGGQARGSQAGEAQRSGRLWVPGQ